MTKKSDSEEISLSSEVEAPENVLESFPIVGIGASAGGLAAFEAFFTGMPPDTDMGMAFVLVQHLAPDHKSILTELVKRYTRMNVYEVQDGMVVKPDCAYIIPPNCDMAFINGKLQLMEPAAPHGQRLPIDFFFRSLAMDQRGRAICIVLSGTGSDGTEGLKAVKASGGLVIAQTMDSSDYDGMPGRAIATGLVDYILEPGDMPGKLLQSSQQTHSKVWIVPTTDFSIVNNVLSKIFILLRQQTGHDFSVYKLSTVKRRIERRMVANQIESVENYLKYLNKVPSEVDELFKDMLIGVTSFFRDSDAFKIMEEIVIPKICSGKPEGSVVRVWVAGCSTGEEAYSIAILLYEYLQKNKQSISVQVFATDIDSVSIDKARRGVYPASIIHDVSPERLANCFIRETDGKEDTTISYRVNKIIRDMMIFSEQNILRDPPFSKVDLLSCRNLLIYIGGEFQKKLVPLFHYSINPEGFLFLGTSETVGEFTDLFSSIDSKMKIYQRKEDFHSVNRTLLERSLPRTFGGRSIRPKAKTKPGAARKIPLKELTESALLDLVVPAAALVNKDGEILYLHGRTGMFLELVPGESGINNILKMAREGLRYELSTALRKATSTKEIVRRPGLRVKTNGGFSTVNLIVHQIIPTESSSLVPSLYLVALEYVPTSNTIAEKPSSSNVNSSDESDNNSCLAELKRELQVKEECLQNANEQLETSNEELKSSSEEMQSINEELQSTNEELETSKEELQSINEELSTVNSELQTKLSDLSRTNNDMNNLLAGTGIGTIFVDFDLTILRFTPNAAELINLIESDIGRPVGHIVLKLKNYTGLAADAKSVLDNLIPIEREVQKASGGWFSMRIQPYRTLENVIKGAVITFSDISKLKGVEVELVEANRLLMRQALAVRDSSDAITTQDLTGKILAWNKGATKLYGWSETEAFDMNIRVIIPEEEREEAIEELYKLSMSKVLRTVLSKRKTRSGEILSVSITSTPLFDKNRIFYALSTIERPLSPEEEFNIDNDQEDL